VDGALYFFGDAANKRTVARASADEGVIGCGAVAGEDEKPNDYFGNLAGCVGFQQETIQCCCEYRREQGLRAGKNDAVLICSWE
jgi:hypothetical protein